MEIAILEISIQSDPKLKEKLINFLRDAYPTDTAILLPKANDDLGFLTKSPQEITALLDDAKLTSKFKYRKTITEVGDNEFNNIVKELADFFGEEESDIKRIFM